MNDDLKKLEAYGVDLPQVMERFVDDEALYLECLSIFMSDPAFEGLCTALAAGDDSAAFDQAHALKGVAGNLGLTPLYQAIGNIVEPLRGGPHENLDRQLQDILEEKQRLEKLLGGDTT